MYIQSQFITAYFPCPLDVSCVVRIFENGKTSFENNYTPISIPNIYSKIFEIITHDTFHTVLPLEYKKCPLNSSQFGPYRRTDVLENNNNYVFINLL